jgi:hypothetical protein
VSENSENPPILPLVAKSIPLKAVIPSIFWQCSPCYPPFLLLIIITIGEKSSRKFAKIGKIV